MNEKQCESVLNALKKMAIDPLYIPSQDEKEAAEVLLREFQYTALPPQILARWGLGNLSH